MTFLQVVNIIRDTALAQPNVNTVVREFLDLNREDTKYSAVVIQDRDGLRDRIVEQDWNTYTFHLGYVDRLTFDEKNRDDIFSTGINVINNIVASIRERWDLEVSIIDRFSTFNQRFIASCAGVYVVLAIQVPVSDCVDTEETNIYEKFSIDITNNGHYHYVPDGRPYGDIDITVNVSGGGEKPEQKLIETIVSNGEYSFSPSAGSVFSDVSIAVDVHPSNSLSRTYTTNGTKTITGEFNGGTVNINVHPSNSLVETITNNGITSFSGEWKDAEITVEVSSDQKPEENLAETITSNGSYHYDPEEGSVFGDADITVDVHPSIRLIETITSNGMTSFSGEWRDAEITVAVPVKTETSLVETITSNGSYHYDPASGSVFSGADISVDVHPSTSLSRTYTSNGSYNISGEFNGGVVTVAVTTTITVTMTQAQYDALQVEDPNTIYLING